MRVSSKVPTFFMSSLMFAFLSLLMAVLAVACAAQEAAKSNPSTRKSQATAGSVPQTRKPTLNELYTLFFKYAAHVEARSNKDETAGIGRRFYRQHLQQESGLTDQEYKYVLDAAQNYVAANADIESQIADWNKTVLSNGGNPPPPSVVSSASYQSELTRLFALQRSTLNSAVENLRDQLGADRSRVLEDYLLGAFSNPRIGAAPSGGSSTSEQTTATQVQPSAEHQLNVHDSSSVKTELTASPENVALGYAPICVDFSSGGSGTSSLCIQGTLSYLGPTNQVETWGAATWNNVYGYDGYNTYGSMTENGTNMPSPFYNCSSSAWTCDVNLSYGANVRYNFLGEAVIYFYDGCNGPCSLQLGPSTLASVFIVSPSITSISQTQFQAGQSGTLTITGSNFTSPFMNPPFVGDLWGCFSTLSVTNFNYPSQITANFSLPATLPWPPQDCEPGGGEYLYESNGFLAAIEPISITATPPSVIGSDGNPITSSSGSPVQVLAGAPVSLSVTAPSGKTIQSQSWSFGNSGDVVAGFNASANSGGPVTVTDTTSSKLNFFFLVPGQTETVTVRVTYTDQEWASQTEYYSVGGPTGTLTPNVFVQQNYTATVVTDTAGNPSPTANPAYLVMGNAPGQPSKGIWFNDLATLPQGQFIWVQILNSVTYSQLFQANQGYTSPTNLGFGLDGIYPYPSGGPNSPSISTGDAPARQDLYSFLGEAAESFSATMYVLWDPAIPPAGQQTCTPAWTDTTTRPYYTSNRSTCASIPVPLASVSWTWKPCVINALAPAGNGFTPSWFTQCGPGNYSAPVPSGYPEWSSCDASQKANCQQ